MEGDDEMLRTPKLVLLPVSVAVTCSIETDPFDTPFVDIPMSGFRC